ncbi:4-hydroxythreonine-4-phosphate dehydrogenase [Hephaestia caeni]|uniref:4-hydroxythreonine-4-phosphate dehydrogenase n=1 Tax=Hephaestia caeni TaxID=645617 RepID=A0A397P9F3_9SPHN|nr:4-hydroxythreonine-4-phosphate dehydrogenase PdxA [Hephaestia caeni]RIA45538.1 4-hydroxythreonine-4-phosphate dehydrogenase [Hephaestia caeni]
MRNDYVLGISMGDPAGIGPEVTVKALADPAMLGRCHPIVVGDANVVRDVIGFTGVALDINAITAVDQATFAPGIINVYDLANVDMARFRLGQVDAMCGQAGFDYVAKVIELAMNGEVDATVTGPINKEAMHLAGHRFGGHTEIYATHTGSEQYAMLLVEENLRVVHVSTHVSLRQACDLVKQERVFAAIELIDGACRQLGIAEPRIGVAGLNPHASDNGLFGDEERQEILPAILRARADGYRVDGPVPADTLFPKAIGGVYDGVVAMYHDQGHIPFKVVGFDWDRGVEAMKSVRGVNITLGLPIIRTSVDHGTAMEIAGRNIASADAMDLAIDYAVRLCRSAAAGN